jgi:hypothetical protein
MERRMDLIVLFQCLLCAWWNDTSFEISGYSQEWVGYKSSNDYSIRQLGMQTKQSHIKEFDPSHTSNKSMHCFDSSAFLPLRQVQIWNPAPLSCVGNRKQTPALFLSTFQISSHCSLSTERFIPYFKRSYDSTVAQDITGRAAGNRAFNLAASGTTF